MEIPDDIELDEGEPEEQENEGGEQMENDEGGTL